MGSGINTDLYRELECSLPASTGGERKRWVDAIVDGNLDIKELSGLLKGEQKLATRFLWLLSEIGLRDPNRLFKELPFLWDLCRDLNPIYKTSFANWWLIAGIPAENEGEAIDILFQWLLSAGINVTIKSRAVLVLFQLTKKYPELKEELKLCLHDQMDKHSDSFRKRADKIIVKLEEG